MIGKKNYCNVIKRWIHLWKKSGLTKTKKCLVQILESDENKNKSLQIISNDHLHEGAQGVPVALSHFCFLCLSLSLHKSSQSMNQVDNNFVCMN